MFLSYKYFCPKCDFLLNEQDYVELFVYDNGQHITTIRLNPKPGEYDYSCAPHVEFPKGDKLDFHCISCKENLQSAQFSDFISINMRPTDEITFEVLFDRTAGEHATYVMTEDMVEKHGEHPKDLL
jgi:hypothetical protein